jgi:hypothetical protein
MRNIVRVVVLNNIVDFLLFLGKLVIVAGVGTMSYFVFSGQVSFEISAFRFHSLSSSLSSTVLTISGF